jgi:hypothetical protein
VANKERRKKDRYIFLEGVKETAIKLLIWG